MAADRYGVSNRATAAIATATLIDFGLITPEDQNLVTDENKVARARQKYRSQLQSKELVEINAVTSIYFDGRHSGTTYGNLKKNYPLVFILFHAHMKEQYSKARNF